jgi:DNA invertase Pin-like site-specific DNA recombinase
MSNVITYENAVCAIRVSTARQSIDGDSPEDQKVQIDRHAANNGKTIVKYFVFLESASKEQQPMQEAINFCKDPKNNVKCFIIKSIDRFTRGGSTFYDTLKTQLDDCGVQLIDVHGIISNQKINTLEHLGVKYKWSEYSPTKQAEMLVAERAKDEVRDIQTRMIGAQIRYARMGYWVRRPLYGFDNVHVETRDGKRCILKPNEVEAPIVTRLFELRARGTMEDLEILDELNRSGFRTREYVVRDKTDRTKIVDTVGGQILSLKQMWRMLENPVYAGINPEKWTQDKPVRCKFDGLVSIELFNKANNGKLVITEDAEGVHIHKRKPPAYLVNKGARNADFPYKRIVMCPECSRPLFGSASRGKLGKYYPAYHCNNRGHYFRVPKKDFDNTIQAFVECLKVSPEYIDTLLDKIREVYVRQAMETHSQAITIDLKISQLRSQVRIAIDKIKLLTIPSTIQYMEEDILKLEGEIANLEAEKQLTGPQEPVEFDKNLAFVRYYLEHLEELLLHHSNPIMQAKFFGIIFNEKPTYEMIVSGTPNIQSITDVNEVFVPRNFSLGHMAGDEGFEPPISGPEPGALPLGQSPIQIEIISKNVKFY